MTKTKKTLVQILRLDGEAALVEWVADGVVHRVTIPIDQIIDGVVDLEILDQGIPYGAPWAQITLRADPSKLEAALHNAGIWTAEDAISNARVIMGAVQATYMVDVSTILQFAHSIIKGGS